MAEKRRKPAPKMTSDEIARHVFPPGLHEHLKQAANPNAEPGQQRRRAHANPSKSP